MAPLNKPVGNEKWNYYIASYFSCHLNGDGNGCKAAYVDLGNDPMLAEFDTWRPPPLAYLGDTSKCIDLPGGDAKNGNKLWLWEVSWARAAAHGRASLLRRRGLEQWRTL